MKPLSLRGLYRPTLIAAACYGMLVGSALVLFLIRARPGVRPAWISSLVPGFYFHVSNACLSFILYATSGLLGLMLGFGMGPVVLLGLLFVAVNFMFELSALVMNVADATDAWYGAAGTLLALLFLWWVKTNGLRRIAAGNRKNAE